MVKRILSNYEDNIIDSTKNNFLFLCKKILDCCLVETEINGFLKYYCVFCKNDLVDEKEYYKHDENCITWLASKYILVLEQGSNNVV